VSPSGYQGYTPGVKRPGPEFNHSPPPTAENKNELCHTSIPHTPSRNGRGLNLTTHLHLRPNIRMSCAIPPFPIHLQDVKRVYFNFFHGSTLLYPRCKTYLPYMWVINLDQFIRVARKKSTVTAKAKTHSPLGYKYPFRVRCGIDVTRQRPDRYPHKVSLALSNPMLLPAAYSPALICSGR
jgi:hypothetical protein